MEMKKLYKELQIKKIDEGLLFSRSHKLGFGAFGEVYLGFNENSHTPFAVKVLNLEKIMTNQNQENFIKKIKDEIVNMQIAKNEHIVQFQQAKSSARNIYILCEYCNGDNLDKFIRKRGYLTQTEALSIFKEILQGFYQLHHRNIVHRDIKPANLLLHNHTIKIADLGFSKSTEGHQQLLESIVGSPMYMSPQIFQRQKYTEKTDIWSLGVIFYEMLYGASPWAESRNLLQLKEKIRKQVVFPQYPFVTTVTKDCIKSMLVVEEKDRINWELLFHHYLINKPQQLQLPFKSEQYNLDPTVEQYFRKSYFIQTNLHLHKQMKLLNLLSEQQLADLSPKYGSSEHFFNEVRFLSANKDLIEQYYGFYLQKSNQISFLVVLLSKLNRLVDCYQHLQLQTYLYCGQLLIFKLAIAILEEVIEGGQLLLPVGQQKFQQLHNKFCHDQYLKIILQRERQLVTEQLSKFSLFFKKLINYLPQADPKLMNIVQGDLSGIYGSERGDLRVIRFFIANYLKKIFNTLRQIVIKDHKKASRQKMEEEEKVLTVSTEFTVFRMINQYLNNANLFDLKLQQENIRAPKLNQIKKNLNQLLYDWQTVMEEAFYAELQQTEALKQQSVMTFLSKQIKWSPLLMGRFI